MLASCITFNGKVISRVLEKCTLLEVLGRFNEGHGLGVVATILQSPHESLIGKTYKVDNRNYILNSYFNFKDDVNIMKIKELKNVTKYILIPNYLWLTILNKDNGKAKSIRINDVSLW